MVEVIWRDILAASMRVFFMARLVCSYLPDCRLFGYILLQSGCRRCDYPAVRLSDCRSDQLSCCPSAQILWLAVCFGYPAAFLKLCPAVRLPVTSAARYLFGYPTVRPSVFPAARLPFYSAAQLLVLASSSRPGCPWCPPLSIELLVIPLPDMHEIKVFLFPKVNWG